MTKLVGSIASVAIAIFLAAGCGSQLGNLESSDSGSVEEAVPKSAFDTELRAACGDESMTPEGELVFRRWPYLQKMTDHGVEILWTTSPGNAPAEIHVTNPTGETVALVPSEVDEQSQRAAHVQYASNVSGLEPDTIYCYEVIGDSTWLGRTGFRTAPAVGSGAPVRVVVIGDLGKQTSDQYAIRNQLKNVEFDLVLVVGDLAYDNGTLADHENNFFTVYRELLMKVPFFVISGNHDYASDGAVFREVFALFENGGEAGRERWYSFDWGDVHFTAIDTEVLGEAQARWVEDDLKSTKRSHKIVFLHKPPFSSGWHGSESSVQDLFVPSFVQAGVDLVLAGHDHNYERTNPIDGVTYVVTGSAGRGTRGVGSSGFTAYAEEVAHFTYLEILPNGIQLNAIDGLGGDFDTAVIGN